MKNRASHAPPRRLAPPRQPVQLELRRSSSPEAGRPAEGERTSPFWRWVILVTLFHVVLIGVVCWLFEMAPKPVPPETFMSLLPPGETVHGAPGAQDAPKTNPTPPPAQQEETPPPDPTPPSVTPPTPVAATPLPAPPIPPTLLPPPDPVPPPVVRNDAPPLIPRPPAPVHKPVTPKPPKIKVDLNLVEVPVAAKHTAKPKVHAKPLVKTTTTSTETAESEAPSPSDRTEMSAAEVAAQLGKKLEAEGVASAVEIGPSGSEKSRNSDFRAFYAVVHDQVLSEWVNPNLSAETTVQPVVMIHVEKDGRVPPELVKLTQSSGNAAYDDSAVVAAKSLGYVRQPLPDGCSPDIYVNFTLTR